MEYVKNHVLVYYEIKNETSISVLSKNFKYYINNIYIFYLLVKPLAN
jgi:hypothetical protein